MLFINHGMGNHLWSFYDKSTNTVELLNFYYEMYLASCFFDK